MRPLCPRLGCAGLGRGPRNPCPERSKVAGGVKTHYVAGCAVDVVGLVFFVRQFGNRLGTGHFPADKGLVGLGDFAHFFLDAFEVAWANRLIEVNIVIKPVVHGRAVNEFGIGPQAANRLGHNMRTTVAHYFQPFGVFGCDDLDARVSVYRRGQVNEYAR